MYVIAAVGLWLLCRAWRELGDANTDRLLFANTLIGFGFWHVLDGVLSHWIPQIHRIRINTENALVWDLVWFGSSALRFWLLDGYSGATSEPPGGAVAAAAP